VLTSLSSFSSSSKELVVGTGLLGWCLFIFGCFWDITGCYGAVPISLFTADFIPRSVHVYLLYYV
jgi:hypothetical protein